MSYAAQAALAGKRVLDVPIAARGRRRPRPRRAARGAGEPRAQRGAAGDPRPDAARQPDGHGRARAARRGGVRGRRASTACSSSATRSTATSPTSPTRCSAPPTLLPERVFVTNGLSKSMALGGWRIGFCRLPDGPLGAEATAAAERRSRARCGRASPRRCSTRPPTSSASPPEVRDHVDRSRRLHRLVTTAAHEQVIAAGALCRPPSGAFYLYPDLEPLRPALARHGVSTGAQLAERCCSSATTSPCSRARRSATTRARCASAWRRACSTAPTRRSAGRRCAPTTRSRCRGSPARWSASARRSAPCAE